MGADDASGRMDVAQAPLPARNADRIERVHVPKGQRKSSQRHRRPSELIAADREEGAVSRAIADLAAVGCASSEASVDASQAIARMCSNTDLRQACVDLGAVAAICSRLDACPPEGIAIQCCVAARALCTGSAEQQERFVALGGLNMLLSCLGKSPALATASCRALEHVATGVRAAERREAACGIGAFPALVATMHRWQAEPTACIACRAALRSLTRDSPMLQDAARGAGVESAWLL